MSLPGDRPHLAGEDHAEDVAQGWRRDRRLTVLLSLVVLVLGLARLLTGPWSQTYDPGVVRLLEGWPVAWEVVYYLVHWPTFLGDAAPEQAFSPVHYRAFIPLFLAVTLSGWTGSVYWSLAAVDLVFWWLAGLASYYGARRLGAAPWTGILSALLVVASPLFVSNMWAHVLHLAEFATLPLGLLGALVLVEEARRAWRLAHSLGLLLLLLSLGYQYQWLMIPLLLVLVLADPRLRAGPGLAAVVGAVLVYTAGSAVLKVVLGAAAPGPADSLGQAVFQPHDLVLKRLGEIDSPAALVRALPGWRHVELMAQVYHPVVFVAGLAGLPFLPRRTRYLALVALAGTLLVMTLYGAPWTAMSAYPFVYLGAAATCTVMGSGLARTVARGPWGPESSCRRSRRRPTRLAAGTSLALAIVLATLTNLDLVGDRRFLLQWWEYYAGPIVF